MIDNFALALTHGLLVLGIWRLLQRNDLDGEAPQAEPPEDAPAPPKRGTLRRG